MIHRLLKSTSVTLSVDTSFPMQISQNTQILCFSWILAVFGWGGCIIRIGIGFVLLVGIDSVDSSVFRRRRTSPFCLLSLKESAGSGCDVSASVAARPSSNSLIKKCRCLVRRSDQEDWNDRFRIDDWYAKGQTAVVWFCYSNRWWCSLFFNRVIFF